MKVLISFILLSLIFGLTFVNGIRYPENCGTGQKLRIMSQYSNGDRWSSGYYGPWFTLGNDTTHFTIQEQYDNITELHTYTKVCHTGQQCYVHDSSKTNSAVVTLLLTPSSEIDIVKLETTGKLEHVNLTITVDDISCTIHATFQDCSVVSPLIVHSPSSQYLSTGTIDCENGYDLRSGESVDTFCMMDARWNNTEQQQCIRKPPGKYGAWKGGDCSQSCGGGFINSTRTCTDGLCNKTLSKMEGCNEFECPVHPRVMFGGKKYCNWTRGVQSSCNFTFRSNPLADDVTLFAVNTGMDMEIKFKYLNFTLEDDIQKITITDLQSNQLKSEILELRIASTSYPDNILIIPFTLTSPPQLNAAGRSLGVSVITLVVVASLCTLIAGGISVLAACNWKRSRNNQISTGSYSVAEAEAEIEEDQASVAESVHSRKIEV